MNLFDKFAVLNIAMGLLWQALGEKSGSVGSFALAAVLIFVSIVFHQAEKGSKSQ